MLPEVAPALDLAALCQKMEETTGGPAEPSGHFHANVACKSVWDDARDSCVGKRRKHAWPRGVTNHEAGRFHAQPPMEAR